MLWLGPPGVGKSFSVQALGYQAIKCGFLVYYRSVFDVVRDFMQDEAFGGQDRVLAKYLMPDLLVIDDMGMKQLPNKSGEFLFEKKAPRFNLLDLNEALDKLEAEDARAAALVRLRFFTGLTRQQAAASLGVSVATVDNDWAYAKSWLRLELFRSAEVE